MLQELSQAFSLEPSSDNEIRLILSNEISVNHVRELRELALKIVDQQGALVVDCIAVNHLDTAICQLLLVLQEELHSQHRQMTLANVSASLNDCFIIVGMKETFALSLD